MFEFWYGWWQCGTNGSCPLGWRRNGNQCLTTYKSTKKEPAETEAVEKDSPELLHISVCMVTDSARCALNHSRTKIHINIEKLEIKV